MKRILSCFLFLAVAQKVHATFGVAQECQSFSGCYSLAVASQTAAGAATAMLNGATIGSTNIKIDANAGVRLLTVINLDSTVNLFCSDIIGVSTLTGTGFGAKTGMPIPGGTVGAAATKQTFTIVPNEQFYCANDSVTKTINAVACVCR